MPTVLALAEPHDRLMHDLLRAWLPALPRRFYAHLTEGVADALADDYHLQPHGTFLKMGLTDRSRVTALSGSEAVALTAADMDELLALYTASYPGNWFVPRMLQTGCYFGIRRAGVLVCVAGVHVYSPHYKVAALGNVTTRPDARGQGFGTAATAKLCQWLLQAGIEHVGLNVKADNDAAIACYKKLGFERIANYGEYTVVASGQ
jgi:RimJ/RimL family protein N-acetyltransferase